MTILDISVSKRGVLNSRCYFECFFVMSEKSKQGLKSKTQGVR